MKVNKCVWSFEAITQVFSFYGHPSEKEFSREQILINDGLTLLF